MAQSPPAFVTPSALRWARESVGLELEEAAQRIRVNAAKLEKAERGDTYLTIRQAEQAAKVYERPLAAFFLPQPPDEEPPEAQFRRLPGAPAPPWPTQLRVLARRIRSRQEAAAEIYDLLDEQPPWSTVPLEYVESPEVLATHARVLLGITLAEQKEWRDRSGYQPLREWIDAVEALGVLVMQDGSLTVDEMRGFASTHPSVPAIVVNTNDDPRSRAFTTIHELGHLVRVRAGRPSGPSTEQWCNDFASSVLMPRGWFARDFRRLANRPLLDSIDALALEYGTTAYATAVRAGRIHLAPQRDVDDVIDEIRERGRDGGEQAGGGGNYYLTTVTRLGPAYIRLVLAAMEGQAVTYPAAAELLGVKVNNFGKLRERIALRGR